ncbi:aspartyl protease AED1-like [Asparagus officinalis]|uniref:aspartyl protease AED1-like n=1 Tax=Asparagus officinalis TaxID=4686 RepID=UPI00098E3F0C|nr:aspartyl protease AED1-like [Asparagus officinalis]
MASLSSLLYSCALILLLSFMTCPCSQVDGVGEANHHVVNVQSLLPEDVCSPSKAESDPSKLQVVHRHGPCSPMKPRHKPTNEQILNRDQARVDWLHRKSSSSAATTFGHTGGNHSPSNLRHPASKWRRRRTWIQCQPCVPPAYQQQDHLFDPAKSSTYRNISCTSPFCSALDISSCSASTCLYAVQYGDNSYTVGFFAQDTLKLSDAGLISDFRFGCGEKNNGLYGQIAGILGLGRQPVSVVMQAADKFGGVFSYCLPSRASSTGYLKFPTAYSALKSAFRQAMTRYPTAPTASILDTCYDLRRYTTIAIPTVVFQYRGATTSLDPAGILYPVSASQTCLAFAPNGDDSDMVIIGNTQQRRFNVVYDVMNKRIGFGPGGC